MNSLPITYAGEQLILFAEKALFWKREQTLIIADPHFGKAAAFRQLGVPVPEDVTSTDLLRLDTLLNHTESRRLLILGDFFHARTGRTEAMMNTLQHWCERRRELQMLLMPGNHDRSAGSPPACWNIDQVDELIEGPFAFRHEPASRRKLHVVAGHLHPSIRVGESIGGGLRAPCFWFGQKQVILPAFGSFTGTHPIQPSDNDRVFAIHAGEVFEIPKSLF